MTDAIGFLETSASIGLALARASDRAYWSVLLWDGRILGEWQGLDWTEIPQGIRSVRLYTPIGEYAEFGGVAGGIGQSLDGFAFQLKKWLGVFGPDGGNFCEAQLIGCVDQPDGGCLVYAFEYGTRQLLKFRDNARNMRYRAIGPISAANLALRPELAGA